MAIFNKFVGLYHFLADRVPSDLPLVRPLHHMENPWQRDGIPLVTRVKTESELKKGIEKAIQLLGNLGAVFSRGDRCFIKPNFNSPDPFPASTDLPFLRAVIEIMLDFGIKITVGESSGGISRPTRNVFQKLGVYDLVRSLGVRLMDFDATGGDWVRVKISGDYLDAVTIPRTVYEADKRIYLPCMKTHALAGFTGALKLAFGLVHPGERRSFHMGNLQQKLAEVNLVWLPDLILMDGRKAFVTGGPERGQLVQPGIILASGDMVAIDIEAIKLLLSYKAHNKLPADPLKLVQIESALSHCLGSAEYIITED